MTPEVADRHVDATRRFNRFYTRWIGVLAEGLVDSPFSLAEARVLYELAHKRGVTATALSEELALDPGYLSRILAGLGTNGLIARARSATDARERPIALTARGRKAFAGLDRATRDQVSALLQPLPPGGREDLVRSMERIEKLLEPSADTAPFILRQPQPGDMGWVIHRHGTLYAQEYGFDADFETLVAGIVAGFANAHDPSRERCWIAERDGGVIGSIFLVRESDKTAKLRLLYVEPEARGLGVGQRLVAECVETARRFGYRTLNLWTQNNLIAARHIYQAAGFRLVREAPHHSFGQDLVEQTWTLKL